MARGSIQVSEAPGGNHLSVTLVKPRELEFLIRGAARDGLVVNAFEAAEVIMPVSGLERTQTNVRVAEAVRTEHLFKPAQLLECLPTCHGAGEGDAQTDAFRIDELSM